MRAMIKTPDDQALRLNTLTAWLAEVLDEAPGPLMPASSDASFRRYFRTVVGETSYIVMDAPPQHEDCRAYIKVAGLLHAAGLHAPEIFAADVERGFTLLSDLGRDTYLDVIDASNADDLFADAIEALVRWQQATESGRLPAYDMALLRRELDLFPQWYLGRYLGIELSAEQSGGWDACCELLIASAQAQPQVYVHRDYMPRNLMVSTPNPGILDFQDAVIGPIGYDIACLFKDAFLSWPEERVAGWHRQYWDAARRAGVPVQADWHEFERAVDWIGLHRHLKVLGIFARLKYRDDKPQYLAETPRFLDYARPVARKYTELAPLAALFDQVDAAR